jgi:deazaflavin-dependent oxidoreductase (nitroreductase family)
LVSIGAVEIRLDEERSTMRATLEGSEVAGSVAKQRVLQSVQRSVVNPLVKLAWRLGIGPPGDALLETTGRRTGQPRVTPVCDCLEGDTFWIIAQRGRAADYVRNIQTNPRVRVKGSLSDKAWHAGTAHILDADDPIERARILGRGNRWRRLCLETSARAYASPLTIRIDLDPR